MYNRFALDFYKINNNTFVDDHIDIRFQFKFEKEKNNFECIIPSRLTHLLGNSYYGYLPKDHTLYKPLINNLECDRIYDFEGIPKKFQNLITLNEVNELFELIGPNFIITNLIQLNNKYKIYNEIYTYIGFKLPLISLIQPCQYRNIFNNSNVIDTLMKKHIGTYGIFRYYFGFVSKKYIYDLSSAVKYHSYNPNWLIFAIQDGYKFQNYIIYEYLDYRSHYFSNSTKNYYNYYKDTFIHYFIEKNIEIFNTEFFMNGYKLLLHPEEFKVLTEHNIFYTFESKDILNIIKKNNVELFFYIYEELINHEVYRNNLFQIVSIDTFNLDEFINPILHTYSIKLFNYFNEKHPLFNSYFNKNINNLLFNFTYYFDFTGRCLTYNDYQILIDYIKFLNLPIEYIKHFIYNSLSLIRYDDNYIKKNDIYRCYHLYSIKFLYKLLNMTELENNFFSDYLVRNLSFDILKKNGIIQNDIPLTNNTLILKSISDYIQFLENKINNRLSILP